MVVPLDKCIARPNEGSREYPLIDHLEKVAFASGSPNGDLLAKCLFLAGLLHDVGKAQLKWQQYIKNPAKIKGGVNHAFLGAALFFLFADHLYRNQLPGNENDFINLILNLTRDIANHHGALDDLDYNEPPWESAWQTSALKETDLTGLNGLVSRYLPEACPHWATDADKVAQEVQRGRKMWFRFHLTLEDYRHIQHFKAAKLCVRTHTGRLIAADRFDAGELETVYLEQKESIMAIKRLNEYCTDKSGELHAQGGNAITRERQRCREEATKTYLADPDKQFYQLQLPTGLGKTITGLNVSLLACASCKKKRIIYVAPYLSILSQAAQEIEKATGLEVLQHHHLSVARNKEFDKKDYLIMESWQAPVVVTSFNQFFNGLFPKRAQHTLRLNAMDEAFIIIDEPQIIDQGSWNLFLVMLEALVRVKNMQVLLMTATMPPQDILQKHPYPLVTQIPAPNRYQISVEPNQWEQETLALQVLNDCKENSSVAVILNTIADAANLFIEIERLKDGQINCFNLHGAMYPLHKKHVIDEIKNNLDKKQPTLAITTQIIEAGVDLSFQRLWRARPILPSIAQAAGRANRHGADEQALVKVFDYIRNGKPTRHYVYKDAIAREETDALLNIQAEWKETEINYLVGRFYQNYFQRQPGTAALTFLNEAAAGMWSKLAGINPFKDSGYHRIPVFVPQGMQWINSISDLMKEFNLQTIDEIYEKYIEVGWLEQLSFIKRKRFMALLQQFVVPVSEKMAKKVCTQRSQSRSIYYIAWLEDYSEKTGFGHLIGQENEAVYMI